MDATQESTTERLAELRALQERAYGPNADIADDPAARARLAELERTARTPVTPPVVPQVAAPVPEPTTVLGPAEVETPAADVAPPVSSEAPASASSPDPTGPAAPIVRRMRRARDAVVSVFARLPAWAGWLVAGGLVAAIVLLALVSAILTPGPTATLSVRPDGQVASVNGVSESVYEYYHVDSDDLIEYTAYSKFTVWSVVGDDGNACILVAFSGQFYGMACAPPPLDPVLDMPIEPMTFGIDAGYGLELGGMVRFVLKGDRVEVWIGHPPEAVAFGGPEL